MAVFRFILLTHTTVRFTARTHKHNETTKDEKEQNKQTRAAEKG